MQCIFFIIIYLSPLFSVWGFSERNGARPGAAKVMVVVTDGESHDSGFRNTVIAECERLGITRFGIAVSDVLLLRLPHAPISHNIISADRRSI